MNEVDERLNEHTRVWNAKPTLRTIYTDYHHRLVAACPDGRLLDIGGGSAHFKAYRPNVISLDILPYKGIDVAADAHQLPFAPESFSGVVMLDVLHHLQRPITFLREAERILKIGGRIAMIEPGMSAISRIFYDRFHHEPVDMTANPFAEDRSQSSSDPWDSNQAIPTLMFSDMSARDQLHRAIPNLRVVSVSWLSLFAYPLSGGFKDWCLIPNAMARPLLAAEEKLLGVLGPRLAFRIFVILERIN